GVKQMHKEGKVAWRFVAGAAGTAIAAYGLKRIAARLMPATIQVEHVVTIRREPEELYALWMDNALIPAWMHGVREVRDAGDRATHWVVDGPGNAPLEFDAEVLEDVPGERFVWKTTDDSPLHAYGEVTFERSSRGTLLRVSLAYDAPVGLLGVAIAGMTGV